MRVNFIGMKMYGRSYNDGRITKEEFIKLKETKELSMNLFELEVLAMNAIKGIYKDESGNYVIDKPTKKMATQLMFGSKYHTDKAAIMKPIDEF
jgi:methyl-accepting chemotaxis protein